MSRDGIDLPPSRSLSVLFGSVGRRPSRTGSAVAALVNEARVRVPASVVNPRASSSRVWMSAGSRTCSGSSCTASALLLRSGRSTPDRTGHRNQDAISAYIPGRSLARRLGVAGSLRTSHRTPLALAALTASTRKTGRLPPLSPHNLRRGNDLREHNRNTCEDTTPQDRSRCTHWHRVRRRPSDHHLGPRTPASPGLTDINCPNARAGGAGGAGGDPGTKGGDGQPGMNGYIVCGGSTRSRIEGWHFHRQRVSRR